MRRAGFLMGLLLGAATAVVAATLSWTPPSQRTDGTALSLSEIQEYRVYCAGGDDVLTFVGAISGELTSTLADDLLEPGTYRCVMTTVDTGGRESSYSNMVQFTVGQVPPPPPEPAPPEPPVLSVV